MPLLLHHWGKSLWYPLDRRLGRPQGQSGCCEEEKNLAASEIEPRPSNPQPITILTEIMFF
jgi:hypothetical protein